MAKLIYLTYLKYNPLIIIKNLHYYFKSSNHPKTYRGEKESKTCGTEWKLKG